MQTYPFSYKQQQVHYEKLRYPTVLDHLIIHYILLQEKGSYETSLSRQHQDKHNYCLQKEHINNSYLNYYWSILILIGICSPMSPAVGQSIAMGRVQRVSMQEIFDTQIEINLKRISKTLEKVKKNTVTGFLREQISKVN